MAQPSPFPSLPELKAAHRQLLEARRAGVSDQFLENVASFIKRGRATGILLESDEDRWDAQNLLDYWSNELFHNEQTSPDATLIEFDPTNAPALPDNLCPYCGLATFTADQQAYFFGREEQINDMLDVLANGRFLAITGPTGSGKSSTAQAGLLPRLQQGALPGSETWRYLPPLLPGPHPLASLAQALSSNQQEADALKAQLRQNRNTLIEQLQQDDATHTVLLIDQFEELFTLCRDEAECTAFLDNLLQLLHEPDSPHKLIITLRSDMDYHLARLPALQRRYGRSQIRLTPMGAAELRDVIEKPAQLIGLHYEEGVIDALIRDVLGEPSALPLLQFTLRKLWDSRERNRITWDAYRAVGNSRRAIADTADACYQQLNNADRSLARTLLLQLVHPAPGGEIVRQRLLRHTLTAVHGEADRSNAILDRFMKARLLRVQFAHTAANDQIELAHEALVTNWPRLTGWVEERRVQQRHRLQLTAMAEQWEALNRDASALLRGRLLEEAQRYHDLSASEQAFVQASVREAQRLEQQRAWEQQKQIKQAEDLAEARRRRLEEKETFTRRLMRVLAALAVVSVLAIAAGLLATRNAASARSSAATAVANRLAAEAEANQRATAERIAANERDAAEISASVAEDARATAVASALEAVSARATSEANEMATDNARATSEAGALETETQFRLATSRELAAAAANQLETDTQLGLQLALESIYVTLSANQEPPVEARDILYQALEASQLQRTFTGHASALTSLSVSPDGRFLATGSQDNTVRLWDAETGQLLQQFEDHTATVNSVAFSTDGALLASADNDGLVIVWDVAAAALSFAFRGEDDGAARTVAFFPNNQRVLVGYDAGTVRLWELAANNSQSRYRLIAHTAPVNDLALTADGAQFASAGDDGTAVLWLTDNGAPIYSVTAGDEETEAPATTAVAFRPSDSQLLTGHADGLIRIWEGQQVAQRLSAHAGAVESIAFTPQGERFASAGADGAVKVWAADSNQVAYALGTDGNGGAAVRFMPDGVRLVTAGQDGSARLWRSAPGVSPLVLSGHSDAVLALAFSPDGRHLLSGSADKTARLWDLTTGRTTAMLGGHYQAVTDVLFPAGDAPLVTASADANLRLWESTTITTPTFLAQQKSITAVALNPDANALAGSSSDGAIWVWALTPPTRLQTLSSTNAETAVNALAYQPDGRFLAAGAADGSVTLWDTASWTVSKIINAHAGPVQALAYSPNGALLATAGDDGGVELWDADGAPVRTLSGHSGAINDVAFHPNGSQVASASADRTVRLWDVATGQLLQTFRHHTLAVTAVAFSPEGERLATASLDRTIRIIELRSVEALFALAWAQLTTPLSAEACAQYLRGLPCVTGNIGGPSPILLAP